jgi:hypothetical protein
MVFHCIDGSGYVVAIGASIGMGTLEFTVAETHR